MPPKNANEDGKASHDDGQNSSTFPKEVRTVQLPFYITEKGEIRYPSEEEETIQIPGCTDKTLGFELNHLLWLFLIVLCPLGKFTATFLGFLMSETEKDVAEKDSETKTSETKTQSQDNSENLRLDLKDSNIHVGDTSSSDKIPKLEKMLVQSIVPLLVKKVMSVIEEATSNEEPPKALQNSNLAFTILDTMIKENTFAQWKSSKSRVWDPGGKFKFF